MHTVYWNSYSIKGKVKLHVTPATKIISYILKWPNLLGMLPHSLYRKFDSIPPIPRRLILNATIRNPETVQSMHDRACIITQHPEMARDMHSHSASRNSARYALLYGLPLACRLLKGTVSRIVCEKKTTNLRHMGECLYRIKFLFKG
jgi:hypothetical protein